MIYIIESSFYDTYGIGVRRKILAQCRTFEKEFGTTYYTTRHGGIAYLLHDGSVIEKKVTVSKMDFYDCAKEWVKKYHQREVYIRYNLGNKWLIDFVRWLKENKIKSLVEIHTFDNINEFSGYGLAEEDKFYGDQLCNYYDYCTGYDDRESYRGMKVIHLINGVDLNEHPMSKAAVSQMYKDDCTLVGVASLGKWQGYERIINSISEYYKNGGKRRVTFYIIGDGSEFSFYNELIQKEALEENVVLTGPVYSAQMLNYYYDFCDIGVGSLGLYKRDDNEKSGSIKTREYCARGIPFIVAYDDVGFMGDEEYIKRFPNNSSMIQMEDILKFHDIITPHRSEIASSMRKYIADNYTWNRIMEPIVEYFRM